MQPRESKNSVRGTSASGADAEAPRYLVEAEQTCIPMIFTDAAVSGNPVLFANDSFLRLTGFTSEVLIGFPIRDLLKPSVGSEFGSSILSALEQGAEGSWDLRCNAAGGFQYYATVFNSPVHDQAGQLIQNALSFVKIDGHLNRLVQEHNEFHAVFQQAPGFIAIAEGPNHRFTFANISYKRFVGRMDLEGTTVVEAFPELLHQGFIALLDHVYATGEPYIAKDVAMEFVNLETGQPEQKFADFVYQPVRAGNGTVTGIFCEGYDVSRQHIAANHLAALQAEMIHVSRANAMGTMAITLAHELNQPLAAIVNYAEGAERLLKSAGAPNELLAEALLEISGSALRASELLRNLRNLTKRRPPALSHFNLKAACTECMRLVSVLAHPAVVITEQIPEDFEVRGDRIQIQQVLINLLQNACEAVHDSQHRNVEITAFEAEGQITICITDSGGGVAPDAQQSLFTFMESSKKEGMGIGLSICRTILENLGGRIWLGRSDATGTAMLFSLPRYQADKSVAAR